METLVYEYYQANFPGQVAFLGPDVMNSGPGGNTLLQFQFQAGGLNFPLLRDCADGSSLADSNLIQVYDQGENCVVIDRSGIVRYLSNDFWPYGDRFHIEEIRAALDPLVTPGLGVEGPGAHAWLLAATPNPAHGHVLLTLTNPTARSEPARVSVFDPTGRRVAVLRGGPSNAGRTTYVWDGRDGRGVRLGPGLYLVEAEVAGRRLVRRVVIAR